MKKTLLKALLITGLAVGLGTTIAITGVSAASVTPSRSVPVRSPWMTRRIIASMASSTRRRISAGSPDCSAATTRAAPAAAPAAAAAEEEAARAPAPAPGRQRQAWASPRGGGSLRIAQNMPRSWMASKKASPIL